MKIRIPDWLKKNISIRPRVRRPPSRWERGLGKAIRVLTIFGLVWFALWRVQLHFRITRQFQAMRSAGLPASPQELNRWYVAVPESSNAAIVLTRAFELLRTFPDERSNVITQANLLDRRTAWSDETSGQIVEYLAMNGEALAQAHEAGQLPLCRYPVDLAYGMEAALPHLSKLKSLARAAGLRAATAANEGHQTDWPSDVRLMLRLAATLDHEPTLSSQLVRDSIITIAVKTTERCLNSAATNEAICRMLESFAGAESTNGIRIGLIGERACMTPAFRLSWAEWLRVGKTEEDQSPKTKPSPLGGHANPLIWFSGFFERDLSFYLRAMKTNIGLAALPVATSLNLTIVSEPLSGAASRQGYFFSAITLTAIEKAIVRDAQTRAHIRLVQAALAVECYRVLHHNFPENLANLTPAFLTVVPIDPFTGEPLRYRRTDSGFVLYSVDRDGLDNGGLQKPLKAKFSDPTNYDLTFTVER